MTAEHPPLTTVVRIIDALRERRAPVALGGSAVLASLGLVDRVRDWDLVCEAEPDDVAGVLDALHVAYATPSSGGRPFATRARFVVDAGDHEIDVLVGFAAWRGEEIVRFPAEPRSIWLGLPIADPDVWAVAYRLIGRPERAEALEARPR